MAYSKNRRAASDAPETLQSNLKAALEGPIQPLKCTKVLKSSMPFWDRIIRTRPADHWTETDLICAAHLANLMHEIERYQVQARKTSLMYEDHNGNPKPHPIHGILKDLRQQELAMARQLHIHATATTGPGDKQGKAVAKHREAQKVAEQVTDKGKAAGKRGLISGAVH